MQIFIGADHAGFYVKSFLIEYIRREFPLMQVEDCGCDSAERVDYTHYGHIVANKVSENNGIGILICGTGIGVSIVVNRHKGVRAAILYNKAVAELSRQHNNANIACFGARMFSQEDILQMLEIFLKTEFAGGIYSERVKNIENF